MCLFPRSAKIFQKTKCNMCNSPLELPSVHFLCSHSFHQHCFESYAESDAECPTCTPENRKVMDLLRAQDQKRDLHDHFNRQVTIQQKLLQIPYFFDDLICFFTFFLLLISGGSFLFFNLLYSLSSVLVLKTFFFFFFFLSFEALMTVSLSWLIILVEECLTS